MDRSFHHRVTVGAACGIVLLLALAVYAFWIKSVALGLLMVVLLIIVAERSLHTKYIFRDDRLIIYKGRLAKAQTIMLDQITGCRPMTTVFGLVRYLLITYGHDNRVVSAQPANERAFVEMLRRSTSNVKPASPSKRGRAEALLLLMLLALPLSAQTNLNSESDTLALADSVSSDTIVERIDSLPWPQNVQEGINRLLHDDMFQTSQVGIMVYDLDADSTIYRLNERQLMRPASTMKVITAITALDRLGGGYQFKTELCYTGRIDSTSLQGDVYVVGGFDPRFNSDDMRAFVEALRKMGVDTIRGNVYADRSMKDADLLGEGWCWDDDNPVLSPLVYQRKDQFLEKFLTALSRAGIYLVGGIGDKRKPQDANCIVTRFHTIDQIMMRMLKQSDNLYAESMYYQIAASTGNRPATAKSARAVERQLIAKLGLDGSRYRLADGSGLSLYNYVSPELEIRFLRYAYENSGIFNHLLPALPIAGVDGTLKSRMKSQFTRGNVKAKTGTVEGVSSLCGYLTAANGHRICFSIINQGVMHGKNGRRFQDKVCQLLCQP